MLERPPNLTDEQIVTALKDDWHLAPVQVSYADLGRGSFNWTATDADGRRWFIKVNPQTQEPEFFDRTYKTAAELHEAGLDFVHAAIPTPHGDLRRPIAGGYLMSVFAYIDGRNRTHDQADRVRLAEALGRLHAHTPIPQVAFRLTLGYRIPQFREQLARKTSTPWDTGPFGDPARSLFRAARPGLERLLETYDRWAARYENDDEPMVMTHGEPHTGNTMVTATGEVRLIDCDAMMAGPRERDLRLLLDASHDGPLGLDNTAVIAAYRRGTGSAVAPRRYVMDMLRAEWHLGEIGAYLANLSEPHGVDRDTVADWRAFTGYVPAEQNWPELAN